MAAKIVSPAKVIPVNFEGIFGKQSRHRDSPWSAVARTITRALPRAGFLGNASVKERSLTEFILSHCEGFEMTDSYVVVIPSPSAKLRINSARNLSPG
jgi:hypothetical protein